MSKHRLDPQNNSNGFVLAVMARDGSRHIPRHRRRPPRRLRDSTAVTTTLGMVVPAGLMAAGQVFGK